MVGKETVLRAATPERLSAFSDGIFAVLITVLVLDLLSTAWMAVSELAPQPVSFYAAVFFLVNATYILLGICVCCLVGYLRPEAPGASR